MAGSPRMTVWEHSNTTNSTRWTLKDQSKQESERDRLSELAAALIAVPKSEIDEQREAHA